jgi:hypothetical protein
VSSRRFLHHIKQSLTSEMMWGFFFLGVLGGSMDLAIHPRIIHTVRLMAWIMTGPSQGANWFIIDAKSHFSPRRGSCYKAGCPCLTSGTFRNTFHGGS